LVWNEVTTIIFWKNLLEIQKKAQNQKRGRTGKINDALEYDLD
jgi:hypothetical protein